MNLKIILAIIIIISALVLVASATTETVQEDKGIVQASEPAQKDYSMATGRMSLTILPRPK